MSHGLELLAGKAIERAARRRGWKPAAGQVHRFDRQLTAPFAATAWVSIEPGDDGSVVVEPGLWLSCPQAEQVLIGLVRAEDGMVWAPTLGVDDPDEIVLRGPEDVDDMVARVTARMDACAAVLSQRDVSVDAYAHALAGDPDLRDEAPIVMPVVLAVAGRTDEARAFVRGRLEDPPDDDYPRFAERFEAWLDGAPLAYEDTFKWRAAFKEAWRRRAEPREHSITPEKFVRILAGGVRLMRGQLPPDFPVPRPREPWVDVELHERAAPVLERAARESPLDSLRGVHVAVQLDGSRVLIGGEEVGSLPGAPGGALTVPGEIVEGALRVQLPRDRE